MTFIGAVNLQSARRRPDHSEPGICGVSEVTVFFEAAGKGKVKVIHSTNGGSVYERNEQLPE